MVMRAVLMSLAMWVRRCVLVAEERVERMVGLDGLVVGERRMLQWVGGSGGLVGRGRGILVVVVVLVVMVSMVVREFEV